MAIKNSLQKSGIYLEIFEQFTEKFLIDDMEEEDVLNEQHEDRIKSFIISFLHDKEMLLLLDH